jgi:glycogen debranching enzyme
MDNDCLSSSGELPSLFGKGGSRPCTVTPLSGSAPHAVFYDVTHDNETPRDKRTAEDALSTGALVTFTRAALGSNKSFDDLYPKLLDLVTDNRTYDVGNGEGGIGKVKRVLNHLHTEMMEGGFTEGHVHEEGEVSKATIVSPFCADPTVHHGASCSSRDAQGIYACRPHRFQGLFWSRMG